MSRPNPALARPAVLLIVLLLAALPTAACASAPARDHARASASAPSGLAFYTPPSPLGSGKHGALLRSQKVKGGPQLTSAASTTRVLYRSTSLDGTPIAVSGLVSVPKGKAPKGGWPILTWAHGTTGAADVCAPSRDATSNPAHLYISYVYSQFNSWLKRGWAVAETDYEGLGTPGPHPYLIGHSEGRGVLDVVRAARALDKRIGKRVAIAGHSQGGQAALFAASDAPSWTPELQLRGVAAFAPASGIAGIVALAKAITTPSGLSGLGGMILASGIAAAKAEPASIASPEALALLPQIETTCLPQLSLPSSLGGLAPSALIRPDADLTAFTKVLEGMDPTLKIKAPVLVAQGGADTTVFPGLTDALVPRLKGLGDAVTYKKYAGVSHGGIVSAGYTAATAFLAPKLRK